MTRVAVFPDLLVHGWDGTGDPADAGTPAVPLVSLEDALQRTYDTDAMFASYVIPGEDALVRLTASAASNLPEEYAPRLVVAVYDLDRAGHAAWETQEAATEALLEILDALDAAEVGVFGGYTTRAGIRVYLPLEPELPVALARPFLKALGGLIVPCVPPGLVLDTASFEWSRLYRLPRVTRDGVLLPSYTEAGEVYDPWSLVNALSLTVEEDHAVEYGDAPAGPLELTFADWHAAWKYPDLRAGRPIPGVGGHTYPEMRRQIASVAASGYVTDAHRLISYFWASVEATPGVTIADAWKFCSWVAARQEPRPTAEDPVPEPGEVAWKDIAARFKSRKDRVIYARLRDGRKVGDALWDHLRLLVETKNIRDPRVVLDILRASAVAGGVDLASLWKKIIEVVEEQPTDTRNIAKLYTTKYPLTVKFVGGPGGLYQLDTTTEPYRYRRTDVDSLPLHYARYTAGGIPFDASDDYQPGLKVQAILQHYGATAERAVWVSGQAGTQYDADTETMYVGTHVPLVQTAAFHPDVDRWLRALGASDVETFLDWLAAVPYTSTDPLAALYIQGPPGIGKSLLIRGLASLWGTPAVAYHQVTGNFNGGLLANPILAADEGITVLPHEEARASETFRNLVANMTHGINQKYMAPTSLQGALRVIVCSNDDQGIPFQKALGADGISAIVERVLYVRADVNARKVLDELGGRHGFDDWIGPTGGPGKIAEHVMWLTQTRKLVSAGRFLVSGHLTAWHQRFALDQGIKPLLLDAVWRAVRNSPAYAGAILEVDGDARVVRVDTQVVRRAYTALMHGRVSRAMTLSSTLRMLGTEDTRAEGRVLRTFYTVPWASFVLASVIDDETEFLDYL